MNLVALSAFTDNTFWMPDDGHRAVVDPGDDSSAADAHDHARCNWRAF